MNHRRPWERLRVQMVPQGESLTEASHAHTADINNIVRRHTRSGRIPPPEVPLVYADVTALQLGLQERLAFADRVLSDVQGFLDSQAAAPAAVAPESPAP